MVRIKLQRAVWMVFGALALTLASPADAAIGAANGAAVKFAASGPGGLKIEGTTADFSASEAGGKVRFVVPLANLDTGISLRNKHMREKYLEVGKYPNAELVVDRSALTIPADGMSSSGSVTGTMTIHGQSKPVTLSYTAQRAGSTFTISGQIPLNVKEFGIEIPSYLGVTVKPDITVSLVQAKVTDS